MVPGFMKLSQDDQIVLLKAGEGNEVFINILIYTQQIEQIMNITTIAASMFTTYWFDFWQGARH
jgi:hypothetical protein